MKKIVIPFIMLIVVLISTATKSVTKSDRSEEKAIYLSEFKLKYTEKLLRKAYHNSPEVQKFCKTINSDFTEPVLTWDDLRLIEEMVNKDAAEIFADSIEGKNRAEGSNGKRTFAFMFKRFESKEFKKLITKRFQISRKNSNAW